MIIAHAEVMLIYSLGETVVDCRMEFYKGKVEYKGRYGEEWKKLYGELDKKDPVGESLKHLQREHPELTWERLANELYYKYVMRDMLGFITMEKEFGTEKALEMYNRIAFEKQRTHTEDLDAIRKKLGVSELGLREVINTIKDYFEMTFVVPMRVVECSEKRAVAQMLRCPYQEIAWNTIGRETADDFNAKVQYSCNTTAFRLTLAKFGLDKRFDVDFPKQLCNGDEVCEMIFFEKGNKS